MDVTKYLPSILTDPKHTRWIAPCLILGESALCALIIWKVPYTEIDYTTYLQQARTFLDGERHYTRIEGESGPLVYPALHLYIYSILYKLTASVVPGNPLNLMPSNRIAVDIGLAQVIFAALYILTLAVVLKSYRNVNAPAWLLAPLVLSKRMHSIFLLRLFNDGWATLAFWTSILLFQKRKWSLGAIAWCLGVGVKMSVLLAAPAVGAIVLQALGLADALFTGGICLLVQIGIAQPFLGPQILVEYLSRAFEFGRVFLYKWTVNWRFLEEEVFLSKEFAMSLLVLHLSFVLVFLQWKWLRPSGRGLVRCIQTYITGAFVSGEEESTISKKITPTFVMDAMLGSMVVGMLCARSLHYQFYAYLGWATPYLLWRTGGSPVWVGLNWAVQEYCWLVFPSTNVSSLVVVFELTLQVLCALIAIPVDHISAPAERRSAGPPKARQKARKDK